MQNLWGAKVNCLVENENMCHNKGFTSIFVLKRNIVLLVNGLP